MGLLEDVVTARMYLTSLARCVRVRARAGRVVWVVYSSEPKSCY